MTGFVTKDGAWYLTRLLSTCCAAVAGPDRIEIRGLDAPADSWATVTGTWIPQGGFGADGAWGPYSTATPSSG
ncbi:hypothetical protein ACFWPQ_46375 [Streptomyces sp. NPDC058464]|uniref:hypothetical protein n=1 Tax=Streptomyces sp. NPDC058464 TaxID=3346511 RepID=UPI0036470043